MERQLTKRRWELAYRFVGVSSSLTTQGFVISLKGLGFPLSSTLNTTVESPCSPARPDVTPVLGAAPITT